MIREVMKRGVLTLILILLATCNDVEFYYHQPANPPVGIEIGVVGELDYGLIFRSENRNNSRFAGFLIFINPSREELLQMDSYEEAETWGYVLDKDSDGIDYNLGIDNPIAILFSNEESYDSTITINEKEYTVITKLPRDNIVVGSWLTVRTYLYHEKDGVIVSSPGNSVEIEP